MVKKVSSVRPFNECLPTDDDDDNFLEDPALFYDELPQPYRRINKIILEIFSDAWEEIAKWEAARFKDASRIRPPVYDCASLLQVIVLTLSECCPVLIRGFRLKGISGILNLLQKIIIVIVTLPCIACLNMNNPAQKHVTGGSVVRDIF